MNKKTMVDRINKQAAEQKKKNPRGFASQNKTMKSDPYPAPKTTKGGK